MPSRTSLIIGLTPFRPTATEDSPLIAILLCPLPPSPSSVQPTSASASHPLCDNENPFVGREPVAPAGGLPGDKGPGDDPGDDPNDPDFYDDDFDDDDLPPHADPTLIVLNNLAGVVSLLAHNSCQANESSL